MAEKNGFRRARTGRGVEALTARKADVMARQAAAEAHISDQLNTFTLGGTEAASAANVSTISNPIHIQDENFAHLETMNTINEALFRTDGGPIPKTSEVAGSGEQSEDLSRVVIKTPAAGEVWQVACLSGTVSGVTMNFQFLIEDLVNGTLAYITDYNVSATAGPINEPGFVSPIHLDENSSLRVNCTRVSGTYGTYEATAYVIRIR